MDDVWIALFMQGFLPGSNLAAEREALKCRYTKQNSFVFYSEIRMNNKRVFILEIFKFILGLKVL